VEGENNPCGLRMRRPKANPNLNPNRNLSVNILYFHLIPVCMYSDLQLPEQC